MYLDSHAHLETAHFGEDLHQVIQTAWEAGVRLILAIGNGTPEDDHIESTISIADQYDFIYATVGVHPHEAVSSTPEFLRIVREKSRHRKVVAWGEVGLDYHYDFSPREIQKEVLAQQLQLAEEASLPVIFHCREAERDLVEMLERSVRQRPWGVLHCFSGSPWLARRGLELGMYISFSGILTFKNAVELREIARDIPSDRLLVETDSPFLAPVPHRGSRNEPKFVRETTDFLARIRGVSAEELGTRICDNFHALFGVRPQESVH